MIHLQTLGRIDLRGTSGETLAAVTSRPREMALLIYLVTAGPGAFRRRDTILALFWPETPEDRARHTLNQMLYRLRRTLGDEVLVRCSCIAIQRYEYRKLRQPAQLGLGGE